MEELLAGAQEQLAQAQSEEAVLRVVGEGTCSILGARAVLVLTPDATQALVPRAVCGEAADFARGMRVPTQPQFPESVFPCAVVYREGRFLSLSVDPPYPEGVDFGPMRERAASFGLARIMSFPLSYHGKALGAMNCVLGSGAEPSAAAREAVETLGMAATAALHGIALREETMLAMAAALEARDDETQEHALRVALYAERLARELGVDDPEELQRLRWGALLHDVGKIGLSDAVLRKPGPLTGEEGREVRRHPEIAYRLVAHLDFLGDARQIVLSHHERWDGHGYPRGLREEEIPLPTRIFSVVWTPSTPLLPTVPTGPLEASRRPRRNCGGGRAASSIPAWWRPSCASAAGSGKSCTCGRRRWAGCGQRGPRAEGGANAPVPEATAGAAARCRGPWPGGVFLC